MRQHRDDLAREVSNMFPPVRLLALNWALDKPPATIHRICGDRVMNRGDNHQTLRADAVDKKHEEVIWMFINKTEELAENEVHEVVDMDIEDDFERSLDRAVDACVRILGVKKPSQEDIGKALAAARAYSPSTKRTDQKKSSAKPRYYAFLPEIDLMALVGGRLSEADAPAQLTKFWQSLVKNKRITSVPHVTIVHKKSLPQEQALWDRCHSLFVQPSPPLFDFKLGSLVCNNNVMTITVKSVSPHVDPGEDTNEEARKFIDSLGDDLKDKLHITVGTGSPNIAAYEGRVLVDDWKRGNIGENISSVELEGVTVKGSVKGLMG